MELDFGRIVKLAGNNAGRQILRAGLSFALLGGLSFATTAADFISPASPICKLIGLLPYAGGLMMLSAGSMAAYGFMRGDVESRQGAKVGLEGIVIGAGMLLLVPMMVQYIFGFTVCAVE